MIKLRDIDKYIDSKYQRTFILKGIDLDRATVIGGIFRDADLTSARLSSTNLTNADLRGADLEGALLRRTNFSGADLSDTEGLDQEHLDIACGDDKTVLPSGLTIPACGE